MLRFRLRLGYLRGLPHQQLGWARWGVVGPGEMTPREEPIIPNNLTARAVAHYKRENVTFDRETFNNGRDFYT